MFIVLNILLLILLIFLTGLIPLLFLYKNSINKLLAEQKPMILSLSFLSGLLISLSFLFVLSDLNHLLYLLSGLSLISIIRLTLISIDKGFKLARLFFLSPKKYYWFYLFSFFILYMTLSRPLFSWDARSIWFFHAKMLYFANGLSEAVWREPMYTYSHLDYPKLIPFLAALIAKASGFWNDLLPKFGVNLVSLPLLLMTFSLKKKPISFFILLFGLFFSTFQYLWNGYMDVLVAISVSLMAIFVVKYLQTKNKLNLYTALVLFSLACNLKNEGYLGVLCVFLMFSFFFILNGKIKARLKYLFEDYRIYFYLVLSLFPVVFWLLLKSHWGLTNDLEIGTSDMFKRMFIRVYEDEGVIKILSHIFKRSFFIQSLVIMCCTLFVVKYLYRSKRLFLNSNMLPALSGLIYFLGLFMIYLSTPSDLVGHLSTSVDRTMIMPSLLILSSVFLFTDEIEV